MARNLLRVLFSLQLTITNANRGGRYHHNLHTFSTLQIIINSFDNRFYRFRHFIRHVRRPTHYQRPRDQTIARATVKVQVFYIRPPTRRPTMANVEMYPTPTPRFILRLNGNFLYVSLPYRRTPYRHSYRSHIVNRIQFLTRRQGVLILMVIIIGFVEVGEVAVSTKISKLLLSFYSTTISYVVPRGDIVLRGFLPRVTEFCLALSLLKSVVEMRRGSVARGK